MRIVHTKSRAISRTRFLLALLFAVALLHPANAYAKQTGNLVLKSVSVDIWPEYDKPSVLIIYHVTLPDNVSLPAAMNFRIPSSAGKPHAVAWVSPDKTTYDINYEPKTVGDWIELKFTTPAPDVQIEYYDPGLKKTGSRRDFIYTWPANYTVENLSLNVQKPVNATNVKFEPDLGSVRTGNLGLEFYSYMAGPVTAGNQFKLTMQYDKPDDILTDTNQFQDVQSQQPLNSGTQGRVSLDQFLPWGVGSLGLLLIAAGSFWYWKTGRISSTRAAGRARHAHARAAKPAQGVDTSSEVTYCYQCGKKAAPGDVFCRSCGTKLR